MGQNSFKQQRTRVVSGDCSAITGMKEKNASIEATRFVCSIVVCLHHFRMFSDVMPYGGGYLGVDFFLIISGYFLAKGNSGNIEDGKIRKTAKYFWSRWKRLFPQYICIWFIALIVRLLVIEKPITWGIHYYIREALMIEICCLPSGERVIPTDWYCGYLLMALVIVFAVRSFFDKKYFDWSALTAGGVCYLILSLCYGHLNLYPQYACIICIALLRAVAGVLMGCAAQRVSGILNRGACEKWDKWKKCICLFLGSVFILYMTLYDNAYRITDFLVVFVFWFLFVYGITDERIRPGQNLSRVFRYLGRLSYTIYLIHYVIVQIFVRFSLFIGKDWKLVSVIFLILVVAVAALIDCIMESTSRSCGRHLSQDD
ncbi:MAG: acyltransferase [Clostridium sp.]|nr:acyltransferase [Clostridium sp.]